MKKKLIEKPLEYWEEKSYMMVVPPKYDDDFLKTSIERLSQSKYFKVVDTDYEINGVINVKVKYDKEEYDIGFYTGGISVPDYYLYKNFLFTDEEKESLLAAKQAITIFMEFKDDVKKSFQLQLKVSNTLIPDLIGVLDESAEKMLPAKWVMMIASSKVLPSARDLFTVQAVQGKHDKVWLHTHGLCRCHTTELEILESDKKHYEQHYNLLSTYAMYLIDKSGLDDPRYNGAYIGRLINGYPVVVTCAPWTDGILEYKKAKLGNIKDRENGHNTRTSIVFLYTSEEEEKNHKLRLVSLYDELWGENPIFFFSDEETNRMRDLARERISYVKESFKDKENAILIKIGLPLKEEGRFEHIWFELLEIKGNKFKCKLTQEPYDIPDMHTGDEDWYTLDDMTDWIIYTKDFAVSPSNAYLLEENR